MADAKISALVDGTTPDDADDFVVARAGATLKLTWAALKAAIGGSLPQTDREQLFDPDGVAINPNATRGLPFGASSGPNTLLDISTPAQPTVMTAGVYCVSIDAAPFESLSADAQWQLEVTLDVSGAAAYGRAVATATAAIPTPELTLSLTFYLPAGAVITAAATNHDSAQRFFGINNAAIQRIA